MAPLARSAAPEDAGLLVLRQEVGVLQRRDGDDDLRVLTGHRFRRQRREPRAGRGSGEAARQKPTARIIAGG